MPQFERRDARQVVDDVAVAQAAVVDDRHALITVAVTLAGEHAASRHLTVPVARDAEGGLVVSDLPSFAPPPLPGHDSPPELEPLTGAARVEVEDVLTRFFEAFLAGDPAQLEYLVPAGVRIGALEQPHELVALGSIAQLPGGDARERTVRGGDQGARRGDGCDLRAALPAAAGARGPLVRGGGQSDDPEGGLSDAASGANGGAERGRVVAGGDAGARGGRW